jgi:hypothetical protein
VRFLTPRVGPNAPAITPRGWSTCRMDALNLARPTCDAGGLHHQLEHLVAVSGHYLATPLPTSTETVTVVGVRRGAWRAAALAKSPPITPASRP